ncbi:hypothetical protein KC342_g7 [Hortaea werneckii]|nr:hypothetical protein KC342_g7 [Hortaea werneckii]
MPLPMLPSPIQARRGPPAPPRPTACRGGRVGIGSYERDQKGIAESFEARKRYAKAFVDLSHNITLMIGDARRE